MEDRLFTAMTKDIRMIYNSLESLKSADGQFIILRVNANGLLFTSDDNFSVKSFVNLKRLFFIDFVFNFDGIFIVNINLNELLRILKIYLKRNALLEISSTETSSIVLDFTEEYTSTHCTLRTHILSEETNDFHTQINPDETMAHLVIKGDSLKELFRLPCDTKSMSASIEILVNQAAKSFKISAEGSFGTTTSELPASLITWEAVPQEETEVHFESTTSVFYPILRAISGCDEIEFSFQNDTMLYLTVRFDKPNKDEAAEAVFLLNSISM